jgi:hypothetical protein
VLARVQLLGPVTGRCDFFFILNAIHHANSTKRGRERMNSRYLKKVVPVMTLVFIAGCVLHTNGIPGPGTCTTQPKIVQGCCSQDLEQEGPNVVTNTSWNPNACGASPSDKPSANWCTFTEIDNLCSATLLDCNNWPHQTPQGWQQVGSCTVDPNNCQPPPVDQSGTAQSNVCTIAQD